MRRGLRWMAGAPAAFPGPGQGAPGPWSLGIPQRIWPHPEVKHACRVTGNWKDRDRLKEECAKAEVEWHRGEVFVWDEGHPAGVGRGPALGREDGEECGSAENGGTAQVLGVFFIVQGNDRAFASVPAATAREAIVLAGRVFPPLPAHVGRVRPTQARGAAVACRREQQAKDQTRQ
jgi:hypothetical protein